MDVSEVQTVVMSMFKKGYSTRIKEKREFDKLPDNAKNLISSLTAVSYTHLDVYKRQVLYYDEFS